MDPATGIFGGAVGVFAFFGGIALLIWVNSRAEVPKRQFEQAQREREHALRMKALELGQPLPDIDIARFQADIHRAWAAGIVGIVVPLAMAGCAIGATSLILTLCEASIHVALVSVVWGVAGVVGIAALTLALGGLIGRSKARHGEIDRARAMESRPLPDLTSAIQE